MAEDKRIPDLPLKAVLSQGLLLAVYDPETDLTYRMEVTGVLPEETGGGVITEQITVNVPQGSVGGYKNNDVLAAQTEVTAFAKKLLRSASAPTYQAPTLALAVSPTGTKEVGEKLNLTLTTTFNKRDGGDLTSLSILKNGTLFASESPAAQTDFIYSKTAVKFKAIANYLQGPIKNNTLGDPDSTGRIPAGPVESNEITEVGYLKHFFGASAAAPTTGAEARTLPNSRFENENNVFNLVTGTTHKTFSVVVAPTKKISNVTDLDSLNANLTGAYVLTNSNFSGHDAAGVAVTGYKLYVLSADVPYSASKRHQITLVNE